jgi:hypothetical protein
MGGARLVDGVVRRPTGPHTAFVHELLRWLEAAGFAGAPRVLGIDGGDELLSYVEGHVPVEVDPGRVAPIVFSPAGVASAFALVRRFHDLVATCPLRGGEEVVCHGDLSPWNTAYGPGDTGAVALVDWDEARPGRRADDLGYATWRFLMFGFAGSPPLVDQRRLLRAAAGAYGLFTPAELLDHAADAQRRQEAAFVRAHAAGDPRITRLVALGALDVIRRAQSDLAATRSSLLAEP